MLFKPRDDRPLIPLISIPVVSTQHAPAKSHDSAARMHGPDQQLPRARADAGRVELEPPRPPADGRLAHRPHQVARVEDAHGGVVRADCELAWLVRRGLDGRYAAGEGAAVCRRWCWCWWA